MKSNNLKKCTKLYNKKDIERYISLEDKLSEILPIIVNKSSFKGTSLWEKFINLKKIRDRIIHLKSSDVSSNVFSGNPYEHIWNDLINNGEIIDYSKKVKRIIKYFLKNNEQCWFAKCPF